MKVDGQRPVFRPSGGKSPSPSGSTLFRSPSSSEPSESYRPGVPKSSELPFPTSILSGHNGLDEQTKKFVTETVDKAVLFFHEHFGTVKRPVKLNAEGSAGSLRVGYNFKDDIINFPGKESGLNSQDIITHEVFHALTAQSYPEHFADDLATSPEFVRLHEGLADYFTHQLYPDDHFAEGYHPERPFLRAYRNQRKVSLSPGGHSQGNALTSYLLKHDIKPAQIRSFLAGQDFSLSALGRQSQALETDLQKDGSYEILDEVANYPSSSLRKYRLDLGKPLEVSFVSNESLKRDHPNLSIEWVRPNGIPSETFVFHQLEDSKFSVEAVQTVGAEKMLALFKDGDHLLGSRPFYFGTT